MLDAQGFVALPDPAVGVFGGSRLVPGRPRAHRLIADDLAVFAHRRRVGDDPVVTAVLAAVLDQATPGATGCEVGPEVGENCFRHLGVANEVVWLSDHLFAGVAADPGESLVGFLDHPLEIGTGVDELIVGNDRFGHGDGLIVSHRRLRLVYKFLR
jgi:hypothetical protein